MTENHENNKNLREVERDLQSAAYQSRVPNEQNRLKDQENMRK